MHVVSCLGLCDGRPWPVQLFLRQYEAVVFFVFFLFFVWPLLDLDKVFGTSCMYFAHRQSIYVYKITCKKN